MNIELNKFNWASIYIGIKLVLKDYHENTIGRSNDNDIVLQELHLIQTINIEWSYDL